MTVVGLTWTSCYLVRTLLLTLDDLQGFLILSNEAFRESEIVKPVRSLSRQTLDL